jgi:hypothetical protein
VIDRRACHLQQFYELLAQLERNLGGARRLSECNGRTGWPRSGVYFFRETGEIRTDTGRGSRIVRMGTHALKAGSGAKLWNRLSQHRGTVKNGAGNHRGSIFRLITGAALMERDSLACSSWGKGNNAPKEVKGSEHFLEQKVSNVIGDMPSCGWQWMMSRGRAVCGAILSVTPSRCSATMGKNRLIRHRRGG